MTEKRFELYVNKRNQYDIVDWVESKEKNATCIYNDLGHYYFSSAKALCELLNELAEDNENITLLAQHNYEESKSIINRYIDKIKILERTNEQLRDLILHMGYTIKNENGTITLELKQ